MFRQIRKSGKRFSEGIMREKSSFAAAIYRTPEYCYVLAVPADHAFGAARV
ncbi:MAG: hypothetical protein WBE48_20075 [Xanthobacteraceae bacterium]